MRTRTVHIIEINFLEVNLYLHISVRVERCITSFEMAEKTLIDVNQFVEARDKILEEENAAEWRLVKDFAQRTLVYQWGNDFMFKVSFN